MQKYNVKNVWASETAQQAMALATRSEDQKSIPRTTWLKGRRDSQCMHYGTCIYTYICLYTHIQNKYINAKINFKKKYCIMKLRQYRNKNICAL